MLGSYEEEILCAIIKNREAYGASIMRTLEEWNDGKANIGAIYTTLKRLERKKYVRSWEGQPRDKPGGRRRKLYEVTGEGAKALNAAREKRDRILAATGNGQIGASHA
jgi:DNA-binding PadR family transcriptional regulator